MRHRISFNNLAHDCEGKSFLLVEGEIQEARHKVHSLTIIKLWVNDSISLENLLQGLLAYVFEIIKGTDYIDLDGFLNALRQRQLLLLEI